MDKFSELKLLCENRKVAYKLSNDEYDKGIYFGLLAALCVLNNGEPVRI